MKFVIPLWEHQEKDFLRFKDKPHGALFWECGVGKSACAVNLMRYKFGAHNQVLKTIIFAPPVVLHNWKKEIAMHTKSIDWVEILDGPGKKRIEKLQRSNKRIFIVNYEATTMKALWSAIEDYGFEMIIADECFHEDTMVDTPYGKFKIKDLKPNDIIYNCTGEDTIINVIDRGYFNDYVELSYNKNKIICSLSHLFFTKDGWVEAQNLKEGDYLVETKSSMRILSEKIYKKEEKTAFLQKVLCSEIYNAYIGGKKNNISETFGDSATLEQKENVRKQPNEKTCDKKESKQDIKAYRPQATNTRGEWKACPIIAAGFIRRFRTWMVSRISNINKSNMSYGIVPNLLQGRHCFSQNKISNRSRWEFSSMSKDKGKRQEKNSSIDFIRVDSIKIYKQGNNAKHPKMHFYDLRIKSHPSFSVGGCLVHNSHKIKASSATRTKKILALSRQPQVMYKFILTGTPFLNSLLDIYTQITFLDPNIFGSNFFAFRAKYFYDKNAGMPAHRHFPDWRPIKGIEAAFNQKLAAISSRRTKAETLTLPPKIYQTISVELSPEQRRVYDQLKADFVAYLEGDACVAQLAITKALRLQQIVSGIFTNDEGEIKEIANGRYDALEEIIDSLPAEARFVVWAVYKYNYGKIAELFDKLKIKYAFITGDQSSKEKQESIDKLTSGEVRAIIGNPGSGGIGCNLTAATYNIYFNRNFSLEHRMQSEDRSHRGGQTEKVTIIDIVAHETIDEHITKRLKEKKAIGDSVLDLKELI